MYQHGLPTDMHSAVPASMHLGLNQFPHGTSTVYLPRNLRAGLGAQGITGPIPEEDRA